MTDDIGINAIGAIIVVIAVVILWHVFWSPQ